MTVLAVGLDVSTTSTGIARVDGTTRTLRPQAGASDGARRLWQIASWVADHAFPAAVAVIEGYSPGGFQGATASKLGEAGGVVRLRLFELGIPYLVVAPSSLKKYATGRGGAKKPEMVAAALAAGAEVANDDEADAWWLRAMAVDHYARISAERAPDAVRAAILAKLPWPEIGGIG